MHASLPALGRAAALFAAGALALALASCGAASTPAPEPTPAPADTSAAEVAIPVVPEPTAAPEEAPAEEKTVFRVNRRSRETPFVALTRVTLEKDTLRLDFTYSNRGAGATTITVSPIGNENAMFVELPDGGRLELLRIEGISIKPQEDRVEIGDKHRFTLYFQPLPKGVTKFDVWEGQGAKNGSPGDSRFWSFHNIVLD